MCIRDRYKNLCYVETDKRNVLLHFDGQQQRIYKNMKEVSSLLLAQSQFACPHQSFVAVSYTHLDVYKRQVYDDPEFTIEEAAGDLLAEEGISIHDCKVMDYEELMECVENAEKEQQAEPSLTYYVAECMEFSVLGEYHADLTIDEAFDIYKRIPSDRMNGGKGRCV